jgi:hypothetical protein
MREVLEDVVPDARLACPAVRTNYRSLLANLNVGVVVDGAHDEVRSSCPGADCVRDCEGDSSFSLSRIHVESVIASAWALRFHVASSFG